MDCRGGGSHAAVIVTFEREVAALLELFYSWIGLDILLSYSGVAVSVGVRRLWMIRSEIR